MGLKGLEGIQKLHGAILALPRVMSRASREASDNIEDVIEAQFRDGVDPYGTPWAPLRPSTLRKGRTPPPLTNTGALRAAHVTPLQSAGVYVEFDEEYSVFHQEGTRRNRQTVATYAGEQEVSDLRMAQRMLVPNDNELPPKWMDAVVHAYSDAMLKHWKAFEVTIEFDPTDLAMAAE